MILGALIVVTATLLLGAAVYVAGRRDRIDPTDENDGAC